MLTGNPPTAVPARSDEASSQHPRCAWCGALARPDGVRLVQCDACGSATTYPAPDDQELHAAYAGFYRPESGRFSGGGDRVLRYTRGLLAKRIDAVAPPGPVLDVGSGEGALLRALGECGRVAVGLEQGEQAARSQLDVRAIEITEFNDRAHEWSAIVFWHALEHLRAPRDALRHAAELLAPGGVLVIAVPNRASWQARWLGDRWLALDLPRHLIHLASGALQAGLRQSGLTVERVSYWRGGQVVFGWLDGLISTLPDHPSLYDAIRQPEARAGSMSGRRRALTLLTGAALTPLAAALAGAEIAAGAGGTVYVEARKVGEPGNAPESGANASSSP